MSASRDEDMRKLRVFGGAMPVFLTCGKKNDIALAHDYLFLFRGHDALSEGHYQDLFRVMDMKLIPNPLTEIHYA